MKGAIEARKQAKVEDAAEARRRKHEAVHLG
jgi:hypothetical protein